MSKTVLWTISFIVTAILCFQTGKIIYKHGTQYVPENSQLVSQADVQRYLKKHWENTPLAKQQRHIYYVPTGLFISSIKFIDANTVQATGYVWQHYSDDIPPTVSRDFIFPEGTQIQKKVAYKEREGNDTVIGWYFEGSFLQNFDYSKYPLDQKTVWFRIWHGNFGGGEVVLVPDLSAYHSTKAIDKFGLDEGIVLFDQTVLETYFNYQLADYDTNFGVKKYEQMQFPELYFNVVLQRYVTSIFISFLLPVVGVLVLAFLTLLVTTHISVKRQRFGFTLSGVLGICATLLFIVLLDHQRIHSYIASGGIIYLEYIYFIVYFAIMYVAIDAFLLLKSSSKAKYMSLIVYKENIFPKLIFLPLVFLALYLVTKYFLTQ